MHLPLGPFGAAQFRPPPALSPSPRATRTMSKLPTDRPNWNAAFIAFDTERNSRICGYGDTLPNPLSRRFRSPLAWPRIAPRERREAIQEGGRSERAADRFRAAQGRVGRVDRVAEPPVASLEHRGDDREAVVTSHQMGADARPAPVLRAGRQPCSHWVQRDIARGGQEVILPAGRPLKTAPAHDAMTAAGCRWGLSYGLETPLYFAPEGFVEKPTLKRSNAFDIVAAECKAVRERVGLLDISAFARYEISGARASEWLDWIVASKLPSPGRARLAPMLGETGGLKGDLTVFNWGDEIYWITGSYYLRQWHMRWFEAHAREGVSVRDISDVTLGFSISGPKSRELLAQLTDQDVSNAALPFMGCTR